MSITVLMSTYNGERFLAEQLASIYAQVGVDVRVVVRDDGSTDGTLALLQKEQEAGRLTYYTGENMGPARSFMQLLKDAPLSDFYAVADHDDRWHPDKLSAAVRHEADLYFSATRLVDSELRPLKQVSIRPRVTYVEALVMNFATGCTFVMSETLRQLMLIHEPAYLRMHDLWIYDVALAVGLKVVYDPVAHIDYRQHGSNAVGLTTSIVAQWRERLHHLTRGENIRLRTAQELLAGYGEMMPARNRRLTAEVCGYKRHKLKVLCNEELRPASRTINLTSKIAFITNQF